MGRVTCSFSLNNNREGELLIFVLLPGRSQLYLSGHMQYHACDYSLPIATFVLLTRLLNPVSHERIA